MGDYTQIVLDQEIRPDKVEEIRAYLDTFRRTSYYLNDPGTAEVKVDEYAKALTASGERLPMATLHINCSVKRGIPQLLEFLADGRVMPDKVFVGYERFEAADDPDLIYWTGTAYDVIELVDQ